MLSIMSPRCLSPKQDNSFSRDEITLIALVLASLMNKTVGCHLQWMPMDSTSSRSVTDEKISNMPGEFSILPKISRMSRTKDACNIPGMLGRECVGKPNFVRNSKRRLTSSLFPVSEKTAKESVFAFSSRDVVGNRHYLFLSIFWTIAYLYQRI